jgi:hypothetical protein
MVNLHEVKNFKYLFWYDFVVMARFPHFLKPTIFKLSFAILCLGISLKFIVPLFSLLKVVPCRLVAENRFALCAVNPLSQAGSYYFGFMATDILYQILYLIVLVVVIPYFMASGIFWVYERFVKKALNNNRD